MYFLLNSKYMPQCNESASLSHNACRNFLYLARNIFSSNEKSRKGAWSSGHYYNNLDPNNVWPTLCLVSVVLTPSGWDLRRNDYWPLLWRFLLNLPLCRHRQTESCNSVRWQRTHIPPRWERWILRHLGCIRALDLWWPQEKPKYWYSKNCC